MQGIGGEGFRDLVALWRSAVVWHSELAGVCCDNFPPEVLFSGGRGIHVGSACGCTSRWPVLIRGLSLFGVDRSSLIVLR